jgi:hypothetical protein
MGLLYDYHVMFTLWVVKVASGYVGATIAPLFLIRLTYLTIHRHS